jgi:hypothetical protein
MWCKTSEVKSLEIWKREHNKLNLNWVFEKIRKSERSKREFEKNWNQEERRWKGLYIGLEWDQEMYNWTIEGPLRFNFWDELAITVTKRSER